MNEDIAILNTIPDDSALALRMERYLFDTRSRQNPYADYARVRKVAPVYRTRAGIWVVTGYKAVSELLRDPRLSRWEATKGEMAAFVTGALSEAEKDAVEIYSTMVHNLDPPAHARVRSLLRPAFLPSQIEKWRLRSEEITRILVDRVVGKSEFDALKELAYPLPEMVICEMLGVPHADHAKWSAWTEVFTRYNRIQEDGQVLRDILDAMVSFCAYMKELIDKRRANPGDDLLTLLIRSMEESESLTEHELISSLIVLIGAGHETTANLIGNSIYSLLKDSAQRKELAENIDLVLPAVREYLRTVSSVHMANNRMTKEDIPYGEVTIPKGSLVILMLSAANRDPEVFPDPDKIDFHRPNHQQSIPFSVGDHICIGRYLAEIEASGMLREIIVRLPELELAEEPYWTGFTTRGLNALKVRQTISA